MVSQVDLIRYLGVTLDAFLSFKHHIKVKCKAAMFNLIRIIRIRPYLTQEACNVLVIGLVISHLDYANSILMALPAVDIDKFQRVQNLAAKVVLRHSKWDNPKVCMKVLHWLPISKRIQHKALTIVYWCPHGNAPTYLNELIQEYVPGRRGLHSDGPGLSWLSHILLERPSHKDHFQSKAQSCGTNSLATYRIVTIWTPSKRALRHTYFIKSKGLQPRQCHL